MFDIAFSELLVIAVVALVVIGPEKLPKVARTLGALMGRMQRYVSTVKADVERELRTEELHQMQDEVRQSMAAVSTEVTQQVQRIQAPLAEATQAVEEVATHDVAKNEPGPGAS